MACHGEALSGKRKPTEWKRGRTLPRFRSDEEEEKFFGEHSFADLMEASGKQLTYKPGVTRKRRAHVYCLRLSDEEMATLQHVAIREGEPIATVLRSLIRGMAKRYVDAAN